MSDLDPRVAAALALHKPREVDVVSHRYHKQIETVLDHKPFYECVECDGYPWPCRTAIALGVPGDHWPTSLLEARTWWWQAHGLDAEAAAVAAALESGP